MGRPIWTGFLNFGRVSVPVRLYAATENHTIRFHHLERGTSDRVRNLRVNERTGLEVPYAEIVKGYEVGEGEYVVVEPEELEQISPGQSKSIQVNGFIALPAVDPVFFDTTYYLGPKGEEFAHVYALLRQALADTDRAGLAVFVMGGKQYLAAVRAKDDLLVLQTMHYADEIRDPHREVDDLPEATVPSDRELGATRRLIETMSVDWQPEEYQDTYVEQVRALIEAKHEGLLERSLQLAGQAPAKSRPPVETEQPAKARAARKPAGDKAGDKAGRTAKAAPKAKAADLAGLSRTALYRLASEQDIPGRSHMTRDELVKALSRPGRRLKAIS